MRINKAGWMSLEVALRTCLKPHVPNDVLMLIFTTARFQCGVVPERLASVCHRWLAVVHGALGAPLWSEIDLNMTSDGDAVALARKHHEIP
jgi:hypothetical protein